MKMKLFGRILVRLGIATAVVAIISKFIQKKNTDSQMID